MNTTKNILISQKGVSLVGAIVALVILAVGITTSSMMFSNTLKRYRAVQATDTILNIEDEIKVLVLGEMRRHITAQKAAGANCPGAAFNLEAIATSPVSGLSLNLLSNSQIASTTISSTEFTNDSRLNQLLNTANEGCQGTQPAMCSATASNAYLLTHTTIPSDYQTVDSFCLCLTINSTAQAQGSTAKIGQIASVGPIFLWARYRRLDVVTGNSFPCSTTVDPAQVLHQLDYTFYYPNPNNNNPRIYQTYSGTYMIGD